MSRPITVLLDPGHGGTLKGEYLTAPHKMYQHSPSEIFYEGVFNRIIKNRIMEMCWAKGIKVIDLVPTELDVPLPTRVAIANAYYAEYSDAVVVSLHSNAGGGTGFEVFTSVGQTESDKFADIYAQEIMAMFALKFRSDKVDGDWDKESQFYILKETDCPAILTECLFYDNYEDYKVLEDPDFRERYCRAVVNFIEKAELVL